MIEEDYAQVEMKSSYAAPEPQVLTSLTTIIEVDEMEVEEEDEEDMPPLTRTLSHRPGSPVSDDEENLSDESDDELPSPPPTYDTTPDHPLFNLFAVRE